jgi:sulfoxide reductase heme-binding subunit YedZ
VTAILGVMHYLWLVKADHTKPIEYGILLGILLAYRVGVWASERAAERRRQAAPPAPVGAGV